MSNATSSWGKKPTQSTATSQLKEAVKTGKAKKLTFHLDESLHQKFKIFATQNNVPMADLLVKYINELVNK